MENEMTTLTTMTVPVFKGEGVLKYEERPVPRPQGPKDVLVKIEACGICGTDLNILAVPPAHQAPPGIILGHEAVGVVAETGPAVEDLLSGDRVAIAPRITCGECRYCRRGLDNQCTDYRTVGTKIDGAFAPYLRVPQRALYKLNADVAVADAVFFEPLSTVVGAVARAPVQPGDSVAVIGAGPMGLLFALIYQVLGAGKIIVADVLPNRLDFARQVGVHETLNPIDVDLVSAVHDLTDLGADLVVDAVGNQIGTAIQLSRRGGQVVLFGLRPHENPPVNQYTITRYDLTVHGVFAGLNPFEQTVQLLESGGLHPSRLITDRVSLTALERGIELMRSGQAMKVVVEP
jgi:threonine dehydrogenase-like Zn-dependent dehydrogenase